jgi:hypothetical protein
LRSKVVTPCREDPCREEGCCHPAVSANNPSPVSEPTRNLHVSATRKASGGRTLVTYRPRTSPTIASAAGLSQRMIPWRSTRYAGTPTRSRASSTSPPTSSRPAIQGVCASAQSVNAACLGAACGCRQHEVEGSRAITNGIGLYLDQRGSTFWDEATRVEIGELLLASPLAGCCATRANTTSRARTRQRRRARSGR